MEHSHSEVLVDGSMESGSMEVAVLPHLGRPSPVLVWQSSRTVRAGLVVGTRNRFSDGLGNSSHDGVYPDGVPIAVRRRPCRPMGPQNCDDLGRFRHRLGMRIWFLIGSIGYLIVAFGSLLSKSIMALEVEGDAFAIWTSMHHRWRQKQQ